LPYFNDRVPLLSFASKILNKLIGERDWSAQEVCHILLQLPVQDSSRMLVSLDCRPQKEQQELIILESGSVTAGRSVLQRYYDRLTDAPGSTALLTLSLYEWLRTWDWGQWRPRPRAQPRVINYYPRYPSDPTGSSYTDYCRVKLMLHHPFVVWEDLLTVDGIEYGSFTDAFYICHTSHTHPLDFYTDPPREADHESDEESEEEEPDIDGIEQPLADFEAFARRRPGCELDFTDRLDTLETRDIDRLYNWSGHIGRWIIVPEVWTQIKADNLITQAVTVDSCPLLLNDEQRKLYDIIINHYTAELRFNGPFPRPLLLNVDGVAGSGKTYTLLKACARLQELATDVVLPNPVLRAAPTGIAAFNFIGKTIHSLLRLPVKGKTADLSTGTLQALQALFQACRFLIIDEKSMIDLKMLSLIDTRLRAIYPQNDQPFGGLNILLCGDFYQLPPVGGHPLYYLRPQHIDAIRGSCLYRAFDQTVRLVTVMRQQGEDDISGRFRAALGELRSATLSQASWELLCTRTANQLSPDEVDGFDGALRLYYTTAEVRETNYNRLAATNQPVKKLTAEHKGRGASAATEEEADNLSAEIYICIGARIMLTTNLWTEIGLVNGSMGSIEDLSWDNGRQTNQLPSVILIRFDSYAGPSFPGCPLGTVPVFPQTRQFEYKGIVCSRT
jgi:ATP-dependent DNA helicase PIF1